MSKRHQSEPPQELRPPSARAARAPPARHAARRTSTRHGSTTSARPDERPLLVHGHAHHPPPLRARRLRWPSTRARASAPSSCPRRPRDRAAGPRRRTLPRRRMRSAVRARRGPSRLALLLAAIVIAFAGAFFSLSQDIRVSATGYEMDRLATTSSGCQAQADDLRNELNRLGKAPAIRKLAIDAGLGAAPGTRSHPGALGAPDHRARPDRFRAPARCWSSSPSWWWRAASACASRTGRSRRRDELAAMAVKQSSMRYEIPSTRGSIYDRTGTVVLATSVDARPPRGLPQAPDPGAPRCGRRAARRRSSASRATPPPSSRRG